MATITFHDGLGPSGQINTWFDWANLIVIGDPSGATLTDPSGVHILVQGSGFWYGVGDPSWTIAAGTITALQVRDAADTLLFSVTDSDADAAWLYALIVGGTDLNNDVNGGPGRLWGTDNTVYGNTHSEYIVVGAGDDIVFGGRGRDTLQGTGGDDMFTGGFGGDEFVAAAGTITIADFHDTGRKFNQDEIRMARSDYRHMTAEQIGDDVVLTLPDRHDPSLRTVTLLDFDLVNLDRGDFVFGF